jgi:hypothetical protein
MGAGRYVQKSFCWLLAAKSTQTSKEELSPCFLGFKDSQNGARARQA